MKKICISAFIMVTVPLFCSGLARASSFGDLFGGKKAQEYQIMLEEQQQECRQQLEDKDRRYQQLMDESKDARTSVQGMREKNATLMEAYEKIKQDYDAVLEDVKKMRRETQRCDDVKASYDQMTAENEAFLNEKKEIEQKIERLSATVENLKLHLLEVTAEKDQLAVFLAEAQEDEDVKIKKIRDQIKGDMDNLQRQADALKQENTTLAKELEVSKKETLVAEDNNVKLQRTLELVQAELAATEKDNAEIIKENKYLAKEATQFPKKFADLARHNRKLVKETADMHYNLGVSNIKSKEYGRAVKEFEKVLELKPQDAYANYNLGYIYAEHLVDRQKAIEYFQKYLAYAPDANDANWVRKYILTWQTWYGKHLPQ